MADAVATQVLMDGPRNAVLKLTSISDGTGETDVIKVDVSAMAGAPSEVKIRRLWWSVSGMDVRLEWGATQDVLIANFVAGSWGCWDFSEIGGLRNNAGAGKTGDIKLTTSGHSAGDAYTFVLELEKVAF